MTQLERLNIERGRYGENKGTYVGRVSFALGSGASVEIPLDDRLSRRLLAVVAEEVEAAGRTMGGLIAAEAVAAIEVDAPPQLGDDS